MKTFKEQALALGYSESMIANYEQLKDITSPFKNSEIAELDTIYFLSNILWSANIELAVGIIVEGGHEWRLKQWKEALDRLTNQTAKPIVNP